MALFLDLVGDFWCFFSDLLSVAHVSGVVEYDGVGKEFSHNNSSVPTAQNPNRGEAVGSTRYCGAYGLRTRATVVPASTDENCRKAGGDVTISLP